MLVSAGNLKRKSTPPKEENSDSIRDWEQDILLWSVCDTVVPKLIQEDIPLLQSLLQGVFPGSEIMKIQEEKLLK